MISKVSFAVVLMLFQAAYAQFVSPSDERIVYSGRVEQSETAVRYDWPGVTIGFRSTGGTVSVQLAGNGSDYNVYVDGQQIAVWKGDAGTSQHRLDMEPGEHDVHIVRRNDGNYGVAEFSGLVLSAGAELLPAPRMPDRRIEFIGDSFAVGYGVEGPGSQCTNIRRYENADMAYAALTARALNAEAHIVAMSGKGLVRNYGDSAETSDKPMPVYWRQTLANSDSAEWSFAEWQPQAVVIALGTNDYSTRPSPSAEVFTTGLQQLIAAVREAYGDEVQILLAAQSARHDVYVAYRRVARQEMAAGRETVTLVGLDSPRGAAETGCHGHPAEAPQQRMADTLVTHMRAALGWAK